MSIALWQITHPEKLLWPEANIRKIDYLRYLADVSDVMLPHLRDRPVTFIRYPHGVDGPSFYQKNVPAGTPLSVQTYTDHSHQKPIEYVLINDADTLLWAGNQACIEFHIWFSTTREPEYPTHLAFDLDPVWGDFEPTREVAFLIRDTLHGLGLPSYPKTSGKEGLQIYIPITPRHHYNETRKVMQFIAEYVIKLRPDLITLERLVKDRHAPVYVDFLQHARNKTLPAPYSPRGTKLGTVSAPLSWNELEKGAVPSDYTISNMSARIKQKGDLHADLLSHANSLDDILHFLH